jgi:hypothetical protein
MRQIKRQIKEMIDFTNVSSVREADEKFDIYLNEIKDAFKRMRVQPQWTMEDATYIYEYAISNLSDKYIKTLLELDKLAKTNYTFFN